MSRTIFYLSAVVSLWAFAVAGGIHWLITYQAVPGAETPSPTHWPTDSALPLASDRFTLVLFAHPHCPCSRASLDELLWILARAAGKAEATVVFVVPPDAPEAWGQTPLWRATVERGVRVALDLGGREAGRFGATTSGQVLLFDEAGRRVFSGGITDGRGHAGANPGRDAVLARLQGDEADRQQAPVFGCPLLQEDGK